MQLDEIFLARAQDRAGFWSDDAQGTAPVAARQDAGELEALQAGPANDDGRRSRRDAPAGAFMGSRHFWTALAASLALTVLFMVVMGFGNGAGLAGMLLNPALNPGFWAALAVLAIVPWIFALPAHRQQVNTEILQRAVLATQRFHAPSREADAAGQRVQASFELVFAEIDARLAMLEEKSGLLASRIATSMMQSTGEAELNIANMRSIVDASENQREALQRTGLMISTEILPVVAKLEATVSSLEKISQGAGTLLDGVSGKLQQATQQLKACLDGFNTANHMVVPEIEKRMVKFEASVGRLPEQLDATIGRLSPMAETIADAAMLSTANVEVIEQLGKDIAAALEQSRAGFAELSATGAGMLQQAVDAHAGRFREMLEQILEQQAVRVSGLSRELGQLADTAGAVVERLAQPVGEVSGASDRALANATAAIAGLDQRVAASLSGAVAELNDAVARLATQVTREVEASAMGVQTRLAASSSELMQRVHADTARFEGLIEETAERSAARLAAAVKDLPAALAQRMDTEIAKIDGALRGSVFGLSDQMRQVVDAVPGRLSAMTRDTLAALDGSIERSFAEVAERAEQLNAQFRRNATETTETVLQGYVDFIYLAVDRFRRELEEVNGRFSSDLEARLLQHRRDAAPASGETPGP